MTDPMPAIYDALKWPNALRPKDDSTILPEDIRKGDTIRSEYTDSYGPVVHEYVARFDADMWTRTRVDYFLLIRPVPPVVLPTIPGIYADKVGDPWLVSPFGVFLCGGASLTPRDIEEIAPFTRCRPVAEVAAEVLAEVAAEFGVGFLAGFKAMSARWAAK